MTHIHGRTDANHSAIVEALRGIGASVVSLADLGGGIPDLLIGFRGVNLLLEVKDGDKPISQRKLTQAEEKFFEEWRGRVFLAVDVEDAVNIVMRMTR